jgi:hypothetical protein
MTTRNLDTDSDDDDDVGSKRARDDSEEKKKKKKVDSQLICEWRAVRRADDSPPPPPPPEVLSRCVYLYYLPLTPRLRVGLSSSGGPLSSCLSLSPLTSLPFLISACDAVIYLAGFVR